MIFLLVFGSYARVCVSLCVVVLACACVCVCECLCVCVCVVRSAPSLPCVRSVCSVCSVHSVCAVRSVRCVDWPFDRSPAGPPARPPCPPARPPPWPPPPSWAIAYERESPFSAVGSDQDDPEAQKTILPRPCGTLTFCNEKQASMDYDDHCTVVIVIEDA